MDEKKPKKINKMKYPELQALKAKLEKDTQQNSKYYTHVINRLENFKNN